MQPFGCLTQLSSHSVACQGIGCPGAWAFASKRRWCASWRPSRQSPARVNRSTPSRRAVWTVAVEATGSKRRRPPRSIDVAALAGSVSLYARHASSPGGTTAPRIVLATRELDAFAEDDERVARWKRKLKWRAHLGRGRPAQCVGSSCSRNVHQLAAAAKVVAPSASTVRRVGPRRASATNRSGSATHSQPSGRL